MSNLNDTAEFEVPKGSMAWDLPRLFSTPARVEVAGLSHQGYVRPNNEDHFFVARFGRFLEKLCTNLPEDDLPPRCGEVGYAVVVADGMGGCAAGEVASRLAIMTFIDLAVGTPDWILRLDDDGLWQEVKRRMSAKYRDISSVMAERAQADPTLEGFGTTMTVALSLGTDLLVAHVGDSRAYLLRQHQLHQLTRDHTLAQGLVEKGALTPQQVVQHRYRHVLTKALGAQSGPVEPDLQQVVLEDGDCLLLCTDGLTEMVEGERIAEILGRGEPAERACQCLVEEALKAGGKDNVTVVVARYGFPQTP